MTVTVTMNRRVTVMMSVIMNIRVTVTVIVTVTAYVQVPHCDTDMAHFAARLQTHKTCVDTLVPTERIHVFVICADTYMQVYACIWLAVHERALTWLAASQSFPTAFSASITAFQCPRRSITLPCRLSMASASGVLPHLCECTVRCGQV